MIEIIDSICVSSCRDASWLDHGFQGSAAAQSAAFPRLVPGAIGAAETPGESSVKTKDWTGNGLRFSSQLQLLNPGNE